ncbi:MAG: PepSY domain-containing protein [Comamonadaceae bacterium]|nr:PepSY domain-containing protein [Comamonadaceae bacterium]
MRTSQRISSLVVAAVLATGVATLLPAVAQTSQAPAAAVDTAPKSQPLTLLQVHDKLEAAGYRQIQKIETQRNGFEVYATNREGLRVELDVDGVTGQVKRSKTKRWDD